MEPLRDETPPLSRPTPHRHGGYALNGHNSLFCPLRWTDLIYYILLSSVEDSIQIITVFGYLSYYLLSLWLSLCNKDKVETWTAIQTK